MATRTGWRFLPMHMHVYTKCLLNVLLNLSVNKIQSINISKFVCLCANGLNHLLPACNVLWTSGLCQGQSDIPCLLPKSLPTSGFRAYVGTRCKCTQWEPVSKTCWLAVYNHSPELCADKQHSALYRGSDLSKQGWDTARSSIKSSILHTHYT